jgi:hypothetical protein
MTTYTADTAELEALRKQYPLGMLELETTQGRRWKRREAEMEEYFRSYSSEWEENRSLLCDFSKMIEEFGTYVSIAHPRMRTFVAEMYFRNPDPLIQDKSGDVDLGRILTDVAKSVHVESDSEREMREAFEDQFWTGFGAVGVAFEQKPSDAGESIMVDSPDEIDEATGQPKRIDSGKYVEPTEQKLLIRRLSPWRHRFDPKGRRWDMSDHRYWAYDSYEYLGPLMRDPLLSNDDRARLMAYHSRGGIAFSAEDPESSSIVGAYETDPEFIRVCMRTIWSRPDHMIYRKPFGASFTFTPRPWDEEWARADMFPFRYMARKRIPENQKNTAGFIGLADITEIKPHIKNINKYSGLLQRGLEHVIDVYLTWKGAVEQQNLGKIEDSGRQFRILQVDPEWDKKYPSLQARERSERLDELVTLLKTGDTKDLQHMAAIEHEFSQIDRIMGQGPAERGGVAESKLATESLGIQEGMARQRSTNRNDAGKHYNAITKMIFIVMQQRHTLPLRYQMTTAYNEKTWATFANPRDTLKNIDLHFEYATGSTEPRTRDEQFSVLERAAQILMPVLQAEQDWRGAKQLAKALVEPLNIIGSEKWFDDEVTGLIMQLLTIFRGLGEGAIGDQELTADNQAVVGQIPELVSQIASKILTPAQLAEVESQVKGASKPVDGTQNVGSLQKAPSPGEASADAGARGSAAAGITGGGMASQ